MDKSIFERLKILFNMNIKDISNIHVNNVDAKEAYLGDNKIWPAAEMGIYLPMDSYPWINKGTMGNELHYDSDSSGSVSIYTDPNTNEKFTQIDYDVIRIKSSFLKGICLYNWQLSFNFMYKFDSTSNILQLNAVYGGLHIVSIGTSYGRATVDIYRIGYYLDDYRLNENTKYKVIVNNTIDKNTNERTMDIYYGLNEKHVTKTIECSDVDFWITLASKSTVFMINEFKLIRSDNPIPIKF